MKDLEEANVELDDEEFEEYQKRRKEKMMKKADENIKKWNDRDREMMNSFKKGTDEDLTKKIELYGEEFEILIDLSNEQIKRLQEIDNISKNGLTTIDSEKTDEMSNKMIKFLSTICVDNGENYNTNPGTIKFWEILYNNVINKSILRLYTLIEQIVEEYKNIQEKGKSFRDK